MGAPKEKNFHVEEPTARPTTVRSHDALGADDKTVNHLTKEVRHELVMLPYYGVFDNLTYRVDPDGTVTLQGQVTRPTLKSDAERTSKTSKASRKS